MAGSSREIPTGTPEAAAPRLTAGELSRLIWAAKYQAPGETDPSDTWRRIARAAASVEAEPALWEPRFLAALEAFRFLPGGRVQAGAGCAGAALFNCFVLPGPGQAADQVMAALGEAVVTLRAGGGVGIDLSDAPPRGSAQPDGPPSPGPVGYLELWDAACRIFLSEAPRQGAMMGVLRCDHPDIEAFAAAKQEPGRLERFNLSVAVTDAFMAAVQGERPWPLRHPGSGGEGARTVPARALWRRILDCAYARGEPGVLFVDRINAENNLWWRERLAATNPCGEVPLPEYGACDLGSLNLTRFVQRPFTRDARLDVAGLAAAVGLAVRLLDNVIDLSAYPLPAQRSAAQGARRIGLGVTGLADALVMLGLRYGGPPSVRWAARTMRLIRDAAYRTSCALAREKGAFPRFDRDRYLAGAFVARLPADIRGSIGQAGIRNSHLLAVAPAGSISLLAGGVSSGVEPIFAREQIRRVRVRSGEVRRLRIADPALALWRDAHGGGAADPPGFVTAHDVAPGEHLAIQAALQPYVDSAISKTVNLAPDIGFDAFASIYGEAYARGLKGCTVFRTDGSGVRASCEPRSVLRSADG